MPSKKIVLTLTSIYLAAAFLLYGCGGGIDKPNPGSAGNPASSSDSSPAPFSFINAGGKTIKERIRVPDGYERVTDSEDSFTTFLQNYELKEDGSPVLLYNGKKKSNQHAHVAVLKLPIEDEDLQQCADSIMRIYGEYYYRYKEYEKIRFLLGGGFTADFSKWSKGYGIGISDDRLYWVPQSAHDDSYESFVKFMRMVFAYSGTLNLEDDSSKINLNDISVGDIFVEGGSPGHAVMVIDLCENASGKKAFLLAQGYMPAQEFHVLKNPLHEDDPWYYRDEISYPLRTPEYTFDKGSLRRPNFAK